MIWAIGDIHGMLDPLRRLISAIRLNEAGGETVEKLIFIGDYIDHGPSSKEIMDFISNLDYKTVLLAGNHEDVALRFINRNSKFTQYFGNQWFPNGGVDTYESIFDHKKHMDMLRAIQAGRQDHSGHNQDKDSKFNYLNYDGLELPNKYESFLRKLKYSHREVIHANNKLFPFYFFHALPRWDQPLAMQLISSYRKFEEYTDKPYNNLWHVDSDAEYQMSDNFKGNRPTSDDIDYVGLTDSFLWLREYSYRFGYPGGIVVHGHTPTTHYESNFFYGSSKEFKHSKNLVRQFKQFSSKLALPFLFSRGIDAGYDYGWQSREEAEKEAETKETLEYSYDVGKYGAVEAINIDTGAIYGGALTAIGLSGAHLVKGELPVITVFTGSNNNHFGQSITRTILAHKFGQPHTREPGFKKTGK